MLSHKEINTKFLKKGSEKMKNKLIYETAELEVLRFAAADVIATSDLDEVEKGSDGTTIGGTDWTTDGSW